MVDFLSWGGHSFFQAVFAQGMGRDVCGTDLTPAGTVAVVNLRVTLKLAVTGVLIFGVLAAEALVS